MREDPRINEAKGKSVREVIDRLKMPDLRLNGRELSGPCPECGASDHNPRSGPVNRFNINTTTGAFFCRKCGLKGGDVIALVQKAERLDFKAALTWLCGAAPADPEEQKRRARAAERNRAREDRIAQERRAASIRAARKIWSEGEPAEGTAVRGYLTRRGIAPEWLPNMPDVLRFHPALDLGAREGDGWVTYHTGPAMLAKITQSSGAFGGVHRTWLDLSAPGGKLKKPKPHDPAGAMLNAKMTLGSKYGGTIRLIMPPEAETMVVAEGIETTLTAAVSGVFPGAAFICAVDLGNMAGKQCQVATANGKRSTRYSTVPDLKDARAFVPPASIKRLVYVMDGDSEPKFTRAKLEAGLQRAMALRPGLEALIWPAPRGTDLNDILTQGPHDE